MADVSIYVALITAGAGVFGAAIPQVSMVFRDVRKDKRDRRDRQAAETRQACVDLLQAVGELRTQVANNRTFQGEPVLMGERLEEVRRHAAAARVYATSVAMLVPDRLAEPADRLAAAAGSLADATEQHTDLGLGRLPVDPDYRDLDACVDAFRAGALASAEASPAEASRARVRLAGARDRDGKAAARDR